MISKRCVEMKLMRCAHHQGEDIWSETFMRDTVSRQLNLVSSHLDSFLETALGDVSLNVTHV